MPKKILIIDDDPVSVQLAAGILSKKNYEIITAVDGLGGLERAKNERPDLIILDVKMPKFSGFQFITKIRRFPWLKSIPVLILTVEPNLKQIFKVEGVPHYMVKPYKSADLVKKVEEIFNRSKIKRVLIVDNDPVTLKLLKRRLKAGGYEVVTAENGADCIDQVDRLEPDLVILDLMMPALSGTAVCELLKREKKSRNVPVIIITAQERFFENEIEDMEKAEAFFIKPINMKELLAKTEELLAR